MKWSLADKSALVLRPTYTKRPTGHDPVAQGAVRHEDGKIKECDFTWFGYHFENEKGELKNRPPNPILEQHLLEIAFAVPGKKVSKGKKWTRVFDFGAPVRLLDERWPPKGEKVGTINVRYVSKGKATVGGRKLITYSASFNKIDGDKGKGDAHWKEISYDALVVFDPEVGAIRRITYDFKAWGVIKKAGVTYNAHHNWHVVAEPPNDEIKPADALLDAELMKKVKRAIEKGREYLMTKKTGATWPQYKGHNMGSTALALLTVIKCGADRTDKRVTEAFEALDSMALTNTYEVAIYVMALEAMVTPESEDRAYLEGREIKKFERPLTKEQRQRMKQLVDWIILGQRESGAWRYTHQQTDWDFSVTQYAALALNSARRCGFKTPARVWGGLLKVGVEMQQEKGPEVKRSEQVEDDGHKTKVKYARKPDKARGWGYNDKLRVAPYGSMTTAGLATVITALDAIGEMDKADRAKALKAFGKGKLDSARQSVRDGLAWLTLNFSITDNPGMPTSWVFYYLYGLERACVLSGTRWLGDHDWYREGASHLVRTQQPDGWWSGTDAMGTCRTCFALLFLKRGSIPPRKPVITPGRRRNSGK